VGRATSLASDPRLGPAHSALGTALFARREPRRSVTRRASPRVLDRLGFVFHRPAFHGKTASAIVVQGIYGGRKVRKYLEFVAGGLGFQVARGSVVHTLEPMTDKARQKMDKALASQSRRFHERLLRPAYPTPSLFALIMFRMARTAVRIRVREDMADHTYFRDHGWFESDYYYPTHLGAFKKAAGAFFDWAGAHTSAFEVAEEPARPAGPSAPTPAPR